MITNPNFNLSLSKGKEAERFIAPLIYDLIGATGQIFQTEGKNSDFDFSMHRTGKNYTFELKTDYKAAETNNFFIETGSPRGNSGLTATKADRWVVYAPHLSKAFSLEPKTLVDYINANPRLPKIYNGGDNGNSYGVLIRVATYTGVALNPKAMDAIK